MNIEFVESKGHYGFSEVLEKFESAKRIHIVTYSISEREDDELIDMLLKASKDCSVTLITNIPARYGLGRNDEVARQSIENYLSKLEPLAKEDKASVYFCFENHGKIIMTDAIAYVGSANFSLGSKNNREFGFLTKESEVIKDIESTIESMVQDEAVPFYQYDLRKLFDEIDKLDDVIDKIYRVLHPSLSDKTEILADGTYVDGTYISRDITLSTSDFPMVEQLIKLTQEISHKTVNALKQINGGTFDSLSISLFWDGVGAAINLRKSMKNPDFIEAIGFDRVAYAQEIFEGYLDAVDEDLVEYQLEAASAAYDESERLIRKNKDALEGFVRELATLRKAVKQLTSMLFCIHRPCAIK